MTRAKYWRVVLITFFSLSAAQALAQTPPPSLPVITAARASQERHQGDPLAVRAMNPGFDMYPDSSLVDFSFLLDPPAGKHGFVSISGDGHFQLASSRERIRFWGVTIAANHVDIEKSRIETVVDVVARAGCNLLRLHEIDNRGGEQYNLVRRNIIDEAFPNHQVSSQFDEEYRDRVDYWIHRAQQRGVYVYLVIRGYRTFRPGDGVPGANDMLRAAKPYAFFDPRLIELQKEYAEEWLFKHVNPYTGVPNGLNPAICMLEIENEDSLFFGHVPWREFMEPYRAHFAALWNEWLKERYGSTEELRSAWTDDRGKLCLSANESLEEGTVEIPEMSRKGLEDPARLDWTDPLAAPLRTADGARFAADLQRRYFATMRDFLKSKGCAIPMTAVVDSGVLLDTWTVARELGPVGENAYIDHPSFKPGKTWVGKSFFSNANHIKETNVWNLGPHMARYKWAGSPLVCREWATCWPNEYRCSSALDIASLSCAQDYDSLIYFSYYTWGNPETITSFGLQADPARWGLFGYAGLLFQRGDLQPHPVKILIAYTPEDLATYASWYRPAQKLAWHFRTENWNPEDNPEASDDLLLTFVSGRSGAGSFPGNDLVLFDPHYDWRSRQREQEKIKGLIAASGYAFPWIYRQGGFPLKEVEKEGYVPLLADDISSCSAFYDPGRKVFVLGGLTEEEAVRFTAKAARRIERDDSDWQTLDLENDTLVTLSNESLIRDIESGVLTIATERFCSLSGELQPGRIYQAGALGVASISPIGAIALASLDGLKLSESKRFSLKMVTVAHNRGQRLDPVEDGPKPFILEDQGAAPVQTEGKPSEEPTRISLNGKPLIEAGLINGTWEAVFDLDRLECLVFCDTPNVKIRINPDVFGDSAVSDRTQITKYNCEYPPEDTGQSEWEFIYPGFAKYVRIQGASSGS